MPAVAPKLPRKLNAKLTRGHSAPACAGATECGSHGGNSTMSPALEWTSMSLLPDTQQVGQALRAISSAHPTRTAQRGTELKLLQSRSITGAGGRTW